MGRRPEREIGGHFTPAERDLLELLCQGRDPRLARAREQLSHARWGGYQLDDCECFLISVPELPRSLHISHQGGPFSVVEVSQDGVCLGHLDLWVVDSYLHSVDYMPFGDDYQKLPDPERCDLTRLD